MTKGLAGHEESFMSSGDSLRYAMNAAIGNSETRLVFLSHDFLDTLEDIQLSLMNVADLAFEGYTGVLDLLSPVEALIEQIKFEAPVILSVSNEEEMMQEIFIEMINHEFKYASDEPASMIKMNLTPAQIRLFDFLQERGLPLKYLFFTLTSGQRDALLREVFTGIFQDTEHPNPGEAFIMVKLYVSYFRLGDLMDSVEVLHMFTGYDQFFLKRLQDTENKEKLDSLHEKLIEIEKSDLAFDQVLAFRVA